MSVFQKLKDKAIAQDANIYQQLHNEAQQLTGNTQSQGPGHPPPNHPHSAPYGGAPYGHAASQAPRPGTTSEYPPGRPSYKLLEAGGGACAPS